MTGAADLLVTIIIVIICFFAYLDKMYWLAEWLCKKCPRLFKNTDSVWGGLIVVTLVIVIAAIVLCAIIF